MNMKKKIKLSATPNTKISFEVHAAADRYHLFKIYRITAKLLQGRHRRNTLITDLYTCLNRQPIWVYF